MTTCGSPALPTSWIELPYAVNRNAFPHPSSAKSSYVAPGAVCAITSAALEAVLLGWIAILVNIPSRRVGEVQRAAAALDADDVIELGSREGSYEGV